MNKIDKYLSKISPKERRKISEYLKLVKQRKFENLDLIKLKGYKSLYRVRVGNKRIIFAWEKEIIEIISVDNRDDNTYNF